MMMREIHGVADAYKRVATGNGDHAQVTVTDDVEGYVLLDIAHQTYGARLTPKQARFLAESLMTSADRADGLKSSAETE